MSETFLIAFERREGSIVPGGSTVTSIAEYAAPGSLPPTFVVTAEDIVRLYALIHDAGALPWNVTRKAIDESKPHLSCAPTIYAQWRSQREPRGLTVRIGPPDTEPVNGESNSRRRRCVLSWIRGSG